METTKDKSLYLINSSERVIGRVSATAYDHTSAGFLSVNTDPVSFNVTLTPLQMRSLAAELIAAAEVVESRQTSVAA